MLQTWKMKAKRAANKAANKAASATKGSTLISTGKALTKSPAGAPGVKVMAGTSAGSSSETEPVASASGTQVAVRTAAENPDVYMYKVSRGQMVIINGYSEVCIFSQIQNLLAMNKCFQDSPDTGSIF